MIEPYRLEQGPHLFTDWRHVRPGMVRWDTLNGQPTSLFSPQGDPGNVQSHSLDAPYNVRIIAQKAEKIGPFIKPEKPWERIIFWHSLLYDEGKYRVWYSTVPSDYWTGSTPGIGTNLSADWGHLLCYAESDDLYTWTRPSLNIQAYHGEPSNIIFGGPRTPDTGYHGGGVFIDPSAPPEERYKTLYMGQLSLERLQECEKRLGLEADPMAIHYRGAMFGAVSPDGIHWTALPDPVMLANSDTNNRVSYDPILKKYVAYVRMWLFGRRAIGRAETDDFRRWPLPEPVLWIGGQDDAAADIYTNAYTLHPGAAKEYLMFPAFYLRDTDTTEIRMASSQDGKCWSYVPGGPVLRTSTVGEWDGGCVFVSGDLVPMQQDRVALPLVGYSVPHKYPRFMPLGQIGFATWASERLAAVESTGRGQFTTPQFIFTGSQLILNVETKRAGEIRVEVAEAEGVPRPVPQSEGSAVQGFGFGDCEPICGNLQSHAVTWRGQSDLSFLAGKPISLRFQLKAAKIFSFQFK
jgi:hypothetical protein